jgi:hypothetical protein
MVATTPDYLDGLDLDGIAASSPLIPCKLGTSAYKPVPRDTLLNERHRDAKKLANLGRDCTAKSLNLPALIKNGKWI